MGVVSMVVSIDESVLRGFARVGCCDLADRSTERTVFAGFNIEGFFGK